MTLNLGRFIVQISKILQEDSFSPSIIKVDKDNNGFYEMKNFKYLI